ncbi:hypothetical protein Btru_048417 [Bulinus truncatus]|nr:hypothetical protein Btru_048417 [Bulinus truncatus]
MYTLLKIDLNSWTSYTSYLENLTKTELLSSEDNIYVLLEAKRPKNVEKFANKAVNVAPVNRVNVLKHGCPIAWKSAEPFGIILQCSFQGLVILTDAFGQGHLSLDEDLQLIKITGIETEGSPQQLVGYEDDFQRLECSGKFNAADQETVNTNDIGCNSNDDMNKCTIERSIEEENRKVLTAESFEVGNQPGMSDLLKEKSFPKEKVSQESPENQETISSCKTILKKPTKPPNILVYCGIKDASRIFADIKSSLEVSINSEAYTVYHLSHETMLSAPWASNTALLIVSSCPKLHSEVENKILNYILDHSGRLLSFNCSIDSRFSKISVDREITQSSLVQFKYGDCHVTTLRGSYTYLADNEYDEIIVPLNPGLSLEDKEEKLSYQDHCKKCLVLKTCKNGSGVVVLSQLLLERNPAEYATDSETFALLKQSNTERLSVFRELLTCVGIDTSPGKIPSLTPCLLLTRRVGLKESFLDSFKHRLRDENTLKSKNISLKFIYNGPHEASPSLLPVVTGVDCDVPTQFFQLSEYWQNLRTSVLGQVVFYTDVITTTMTVFDGLIFSIPENVGVIAIAGRQTSGKGRGGNAWLSPLGCAMFTLPLQLSVGSKLAQRVSFLQHMMSLAVVKSIVSLPGYENLNIRLKWPNDIYYGKEMKLGGVLVTSTILNSTIYATIGCGFNVSNSNPTVCINDIIRLYNTSNPELPDLPPLTTSQLIARSVSILEGLIDEFNEKGHQTFCQQYYKHWLHSGVKVSIQLDHLTEGEIVGLDEYGFLSIQTPEKKLLSVQPDGNSFDMMQNLIYVKTS